MFNNVKQQKEIPVFFASNAKNKLDNRGEECKLLAFSSLQKYFILTKGCKK